jgi:hypothetical protein
LKITRLHPIEVANVSVLPFEKKLPTLLAIEQPAVFWGYEPVHVNLPKLLLADSGLFGRLPPDPDKVLLDTVVRACKKGANQIAACSAVAKAILDWRNENSVTSRIVTSEPFRTTVDSLHYCSDVVPIIGSSPVIIYLDCRAKMAFTPLGREFIKSLIHHTARIGDLRDARVAVLRVPKAASGVRKCHLEYLEGEPKFSLDELNRMVIETYSVWQQILETRRKAA